MAEYQWDAAKAAANLHKHGVDFAVATTALADDRAMTLADPASNGEERFVTMGRAADGRLLVVVWSGRDEAIRIISARKANRWEQELYRAG